METSSKTQRTALITGSTSGIGLAISHALAADGFNIVLNGRRPEADLEPLRQELADTQGVAVSYLSADMSDPDQIKRAACLKRAHIRYDVAAIRGAVAVEEQHRLRIGRSRFERFHAGGVQIVGGLVGAPEGLEDGQPVAIYDVNDDPRIQYPEAARKEGIASILAVPMIIGDPHRHHKLMCVYCSFGVSRVGCRLGPQPTMPTTSMSGSFQCPGPAYFSRPTCLSRITVQPMRKPILLQSQQSVM